MRERVAAIYARVSSEAQAHSHTIASQTAALQQRVEADGWHLTPEAQFIDDGYGGTTLVRPALERLRDLVASGGAERVYVYEPDRLARKYAYQVLLIDEFARAGVEVIFLNRELGQSPEDDLLLQVQGVIAEYERAKLLERTRRGKRHKAQTGDISVLSCAPYGYRYLSKQAGGGEARYEIEPEEAGVVRQVFEWVGRDRVSINEVVRRLSRGAARTRGGHQQWSRTTVYCMLKNPSYMGEAAYGKTRSGPWEPLQVRAKRGRQWPPRQVVTRRRQAPSEWTRVPVPAVISRELFETVQEQLGENQRRERTKARGAKYLLQGLICCARCGYVWHGISSSVKSPAGTNYEYYGCAGNDRYRFGGERICHTRAVRLESLDAAVWEQVCGLLENPERLAQEYGRRLKEPPNGAGQAQREEAEKQLGKVRQAIARLIDSYAAGYLEKDEFEPRMTGMRQRVAKLEETLQGLAKEAETRRQLRLIIGRLDEFGTRIKEGLEDLDWAGKRALIRTLVKRVEMDEETVKVVFRVDAIERGGETPMDRFSQDCLNGAVSR
jgi:site-specific DNA recombinase